MIKGFDSIQTDIQPKDLYLKHEVTSTTTRGQHVTMRQ